MVILLSSLSYAVAMTAPPTARLVRLLGQTTAAADAARRTAHHEALKHKALRETRAARDPLADVRGFAHGRLPSVARLLAGALLHESARSAPPSRGLAPLRSACMRASIAFCMAENLCGWPPPSAEDEPWVVTAGSRGPRAPRRPDAPRPAGRYRRARRRPGGGGGPGGPGGGACRGHGDGRAHQGPHGAARAEPTESPERLHPWALTCISWSNLIPFLLLINTG
jgi:hypothetical protein